MTMRDDDFQALSFQATIHYGAIALVLLVLAHLGGWLLGGIASCHAGAVYAIAACALAYCAQFAMTEFHRYAGLVLQLACLGCWVGSFVILAQAA
jgi:hypothetical protein